MAQVPPEETSPDTTTAPSKRRMPRGCVFTLLGLLLIGGALQAWRAWDQHRALAQQQERAEQAFAPVLQQMAQASEQQDTPYDIDRTVRVLHEIDAAIAQQGSMKDYLAQLAQQDYRGVKPEVLAAREEILEVLFQLYARQVEADEQAALWQFSQLLLPAVSAMSVVGGGVAVPGIGDLSLDRERAAALLDDLRTRQQEHRALTQDIHALEGRLIAAISGYSEVYHDVIEEWDRLCVLRDRAYLAAYNADWPVAAEAAEAAMELAPAEREAHLLWALAEIEGGEAQAPEQAAAVEASLHQYIDAHPSSSAPAFLLLGTLYQKTGAPAQAVQREFEQSAAYYPKQSDELRALLNPYKARAWLRKTREGNFILGLYQSTMLGAGYFSPELQLARLYFEQGDVEAGQQKVMDHFARRRTQEQWDLILQDIRFCENLLGEHYRLIFPAEGWLDLLVEPTMFGDKLGLAVRNRSAQTLHNATLVLALQFTDMHPEDYQAFAVHTEPAVMAHDTTSFETLAIDFNLWGQPRTVDDVVQHRAVLISNEAVVWVDTEDYKIAEAQQFRERRQQRRAAQREQVASSPGSLRDSLVEMALASLDQGAQLQVSQALGKDDVQIRLPRLLSVLKPSFRLVVGEKGYAPGENVMDGDHIQLAFDGVHNFDDDPLSTIELLADGFLAGLVFTWNRDADGSWGFAGATRSD